MISNNEKTVHQEYESVQSHFFLKNETSNMFFLEKPFLVLEVLS